MTTTPETPEQIVHDAIYGTKLMEPELRTLLANDSWAITKKAVAALRAAGLLGGDPTEEQVERALDALSRFNEWTDNPRGAMRAALRAAGVAPQDPSADISDLLRDPGADPDATPMSGEAAVRYAPAPSSDREKLLAEADELIQSWDARGSWTPDSPVGMVMQLRAALAAPPTVDEEKLAEVIARAMPGWNDDTSEPELEGVIRHVAERHWQRVNAECLRQGRKFARAVVEYWESLW